MARTIINVGKEHEEAFNSVRFLIENGGLDGKDYRIEDGNICTSDMEFILSKVESHIDEDSDAFGFGPDGASWFAPLRGKKTKNDDAVWMDFINNVKVLYHKNFSVVEYKQQKKTADEIAEAEYESSRIATNFVKTFYPDVASSSIEVVPVADSKSSEEVFGAALRVELVAEVTRGAPMPILGKLYFSRTNERMRPLPASVAQALDDNISAIIPADDSNTAEPLDDKSTKQTIDVTLSAVEDLVKNKDLSFSDYLCYSDELDTHNIALLSRQLSHEEFKLECSSIDLLYITHIRTETYICDLKIAGVPALRVSMGVNNRFSVRCLNCSSTQPLVERNEIFYKVNGEKRSAVLDSSREDFGLTPEIIAEIRENANIASHFKTITCNSVPTRSGSCRRLRCANQLVDGKYCKDCPYPEVVYTHFDGRRFETASMLVASDTLQLYDGNEENKDEGGKLPYGTCTLCGRTMSKGQLLNGKCKSVCAKTGGDPANAPEDAKVLYKTYRTLLPIHSRLFKAFKPKACHEDEEIIVFCVGDVKYIFNKLNVSERGYIKAPRRIK